MRPRPFRLFRPHTVAEALAARSTWGPRSAILAGGQTLVPDLNAGRRVPELVIDVKGIDDLAGILPAGDGLRIGALTTHEQVARLSDVDLHPTLGRLPGVARYVAPRPVRVRGTVIGNITAGFQGAVWPALLGALGAKVELRSHDGRATRSDVCDAVRHADAGMLAIGIDVPAGRQVGWSEVPLRTAGRTYRIACGIGHDGGESVGVWLSGLAPVVLRHDLTDLTDENLRTIALGATVGSGSSRPPSAGLLDERELWHAVVHTVLRRARADLERGAR